MYEELIARLRERAAWINFPHHGEKYPTEDAMLMMQAADAIEELNGYLAEAERDRDEYRERLDKTNDMVEKRWIPVTERLPEDGSDILAYLKYADESRITAVNYYKGTWQDCVMGGLYLTEEGVVTHWMPLPQPPKEET